MRILFLDQFSDLGGAQLCLLDLLPAVAARGWDAYLAAPGDGPLLQRAGARVVERLRIGAYASGSKAPRDYPRFLWDIPAAGLQISRLIRRHAIDLAYVNGPRVLPAASWARGRAPLVFHCHSSVAGRPAAALLTWSLRRSRARVIANCRFVTRPFRDRLQDAVTVIYNGVADHGRARLAGAGEPPCIGVLGRIGPEKGQAEFVRAAALLVKTGLPCRFLVLGAAREGDPASERYAREVLELSRGLPIEFPGWREDIGEALSELDLLVVPSSPNEATTRVIPEAFSAGVPVVAARAGGIPEIVNHGRTGWLVDSTDPETLAFALASALRRPRGELRAMAVRARNAWQDRFQLERWRERVLDVIDDAARRPAAG